MQLFLFLNDLAGRWPFLDSVARCFYVGALPALGTLLLAQVLLLPRSATGVSRSKTVLALALALGLGALLAWGFDEAAAWLHLGNLSPRPWMTRRVNWLVVEPQDDSFPCTELVLASALAGACWHLNRRFGIASWSLVVALALVRMFCGNNYFADVFVGCALGLGCFVLCLRACERHLPFGVRARQLALGASPLALTLVGCYIFGLSSPRFASKLGLGKAATASPSLVKVGATSTASTLNQGEGEGLDPEEGQAEELALAKRSTLFLPKVERFLRGKLTPIAQPYRLLDVEVAPVKAGTTSYRCAAVRFEVPVQQSQERRAVAECAARLVRTAFFFDSQLQNVDVIAVARDDGRNLDNSQMVFVGDEVPVFTASVQRKNWGGPNASPMGAPVVDGLSWLSARSRVYINERVLPYEPAPTATPLPLQTDATPLASPSPRATAPTPMPSAPTPTLKPSNAPRPTPHPSPLPSASPRPTSNVKRPTATPKPTPKKTPPISPTTKSTPKATARITPKIVRPPASLPTSHVVPTPPLI